MCLANEVIPEQSGAFFACQKESNWSDESTFSQFETAMWGRIWRRRIKDFMKIVSSRPLKHDFENKMQPRTIEDSRTGKNGYRRMEVNLRRIITLVPRNQADISAKVDHTKY
ncbi:9537_t:CDS:2 [Funneliformis caledonium]|uniref:9537_t:CDS:1 n=1 Tax=Funneliformis caledonium TaxID=1117310 RepID=A0A9N9EGV0_9GLOM|nr:9537_t:CDS:2 [Funneliformis caledonium]